AFWCESCEARACRVAEESAATLAGTRLLSTSNAAAAGHTRALRVSPDTTRHRNRRRPHEQSPCGLDARRRRVGALGGLCVPSARWSLTSIGTSTHLQASDALVRVPCL